MQKKIFAKKIRQIKFFRMKKIFTGAACRFPGLLRRVYESPRVLPSNSASAAKALELTPAARLRASSARWA